MLYRDEKCMLKNKKNDENSSHDSKFQWYANN